MLSKETLLVFQELLAQVKVSPYQQTPELVLERLLIAKKELDEALKEHTAT